MRASRAITIVSILVGLAFGIVIKTQIDYQEPNSVYQLENQSAKLKMLKEQVKVNEEVIQDLTLRLEKLGLKQNEDEFRESLMEELDRLKQLSSSTDMMGPGIEIKLQDSKDKLLQQTNFGIVHDIDILNILNDLRISGAEAISINNIRITASTDVKCGGSIVRIDGVPKAVPFIIRAIGDPDKMYAELYDINGYLKLLEDVYMVDISIKKSDKLFVPKR